MDDLTARFNFLIMRIKKGDINALDELYQEYGGILYSMAKKYLVDQSVAEDVISEVFYKIVKYARSFNSRSNGLNWAFKIVKNTCFDWNKKFGYNYDDIDEYDNLASILHSQDNVENRYDLIRALSLLSSEENLILYLKFWEGLSVREIAKKIKKPKSNVQYIYQQSLKKIAVFLDSDD